MAHSGCLWTEPRSTPISVFERPAWKSFNVLLLGMSQDATYIEVYIYIHTYVGCRSLRYTTSSMRLSRF